MSTEDVEFWKAQYEGEKQLARQRMAALDEASRATRNIALRVVVAEDLLEEVVGFPRRPSPADVEDLVEKARAVLRESGRPQWRNHQ